MDLESAILTSELHTYENLVNEQNQINGIKQEIVVKRDYKTIQEAISAANENTLIKIEEGLYRETLLIRKPNIFLEPFKTPEIYLVGEDGPTITIDFDSKRPGTVSIQGLRITNKGNNDFNPISENHASALNPKKLKDMARFLAESEKAEANENLIFIKNGSLSLYHCELTCNLFFKISDPYISCIYASPNTQCIVNECKFKGSDCCEANGITIYEANLSVKYSSFENFNGAGILLNLNPRNISNIYMSNFSGNKFGLASFRENNKSKITECEFIKNQIGAYLGLATEILFSKCQLKENSTGVMVVASDPMISECNISDSQKAGLMVYSDNILTNTQILQNEIFGNHSFGIKCVGAKNWTNVRNNRIFLNKRAGIFTSKNAYITIFKNEIFKNIGQGICVKESSGALIEKNNIKENIKANIAIGGTSPKESIILKNQISNGRCEGVFLMESTMCRAYYNEISENHFGILSINSSPILIGNTIKENDFHGVIAIKKSNFVLAKNEIKDNKEVGLYVRDMCKGSIELNKVTGNKIDLIIERQNADFDNIMGESQRNIFGNDIRIPIKSSICLLF